MAGQVVGEDELFDLTNKGYPEDASEDKKRNKEEGELLQTNCNEAQGL